MTEKPDAPVLLWILRGHGRDVRCLRERSRGSLELRILWGDELFLTERFSSEETLVSRAQEFRATLEARGWKRIGTHEKPRPGVPAAAPTPPQPPRSTEAAVETSPTPAPSDQPEPSAPDDGVSERSIRPVVLVVDDEDSVRTFMKNYLKAAGYRVREAEDVDSALSVLDEGGVDAVVLDVRMPDRMGWGRSGLEVLAFMRLHAAYTDLPVLILTGHPPSDDEVDIVRRHGAYLFMKPDGYKTLLARLNDLTGHIGGSQN